MSRETQTAATTPEQQALLDAAAAILAPLARLAVARGLPVAALEDRLEAAFVQAAHAAHPDLPEHRRVSRVSIATGLSRREVARLMARPRDGSAAPPAKVSPASELFTRWISDAAWRDARGRPRRLPRQGPAPSFEALAQSVTRDVHPRSLLEELVRLGLVQLDGDKVALVREAFVPRGDALRMLAFLGANLADHLAAAAENVLGDGQAHFEQALFAEGLSEQAVQALRPLISAQWKALRAALVPAIEQHLEADRAAGRARGARVRIGLYSYTEEEEP